MAVIQKGNKLVSVKNRATQYERYTDTETKSPTKHKLLVRGNLNTNTRRTQRTMSNKATVIIIAHNKPDLFMKSLRSIIEQSYPSIEIIVCFDPDEIGFKEILDEYGNRLKLCESKNSDAGTILNQALAIATGDVIAHLDEGDVFSANRVVEGLVDTFMRNPGIGFIFTAYQIVAEDGSIRNTVQMPGGIQQGVLPVLLYGHWFSKSAVTVRRECYNKAGQYKEGESTEIDMWLRLSRICKAGIIRTPLVKLQNYQFQMSPEMRKTVIEHLLSIPIKELFPILQSESCNDLSISYAYIAIGAILIEWESYENAGHFFDKANQGTSLYQMWMGILSRRIGDYNKASEYFGAIQQKDPLYFDAQWALILTSRIQDESPDIQGRLRAELANEYANLFQITMEFASGKSPDYELSSPDIAEEIGNYFNWDTKHVFETLFDGAKILADEWDLKSPQNPDEIKAFYKETENYIFELAGWHKSPQRKQLTRMAVRVCEQSKLHTILDFGCGIGQDGISLAKAGFKVTLSDLPGKTFDFAKWRVKERGTNISFANSDELAEKYDAILCFDVLEHLWEPEKTVEYLHEHLKDDGILLVTVNFRHNDIHPMHLEKNEKYLGEEFLQMMSNSGFSVKQTPERLMVFRKKQ